MKCSKCQNENPDDAKFCIECGTAVEFRCPQCGAITPATGKFCKECGHNLIPPSEAFPKDISLDEKIDKIQRYLPKGLTDKILSQKDKIEGERKQVTVMFCDMEGYTALSERLGPEDAYSVMDQVYEILIHKVHDYEGTVNEMTGDGIMALFGAPIALEDAPQRALRSGYSIHREMAKFSDKLQQERNDIPVLKMRIGIHTGPVVVGTLGNDLRVEFKAVGDTVNLASRVEELAEPGTTYVTEDTFEYTEGFFRFEALGECDIKGKEQPTKIYRLIAPSSRRTRFDVSAERGLTPFVGRERELELLIDGFRRAKEGRGQAFSIVAEAGVGKSRLLYEFRKSIINEDVTFLEGKCLSYSRGVAYHPVIDILKSNFDIREGDRDLAIKKKVKRDLKILDVDEDSTIPYLLELLSVKNSGIDKIPMSPEARKDRIMEAVKRITLKGSELRPLVAAIEDLHWIDNSSEEYFKNFLESIAGVKVFLIFTYRPEFVHAWGGRSYHNQINLNRLSNRESLSMVASILGTEGIDPNLEDLILEKAEGIPFFIEELIRSLKELKIIERTNDKYILTKGIQGVTIPSKIQDVIMARVDTLPEGPRNVLQTGSVIEREFSYELVKKLTGVSDPELLTYLSVLKDSELIYERGIYPKSTYVFRHALTQDVVYGSILNKRKKILHNQIGITIETLFADNIKEKYGVLAEHFLKAENYEKAETYLRLSGREARKKSAFFDAIAYAEKGVACVEKLPESDDNRRKLIDDRTLLAGYYMSLNHHVEAKEVVDPIVELAQRMNYQKRLPTIYVALGTYSVLVDEDFSTGVQYLNKALKISQKTNHYFSIWSVFWFTALGLYYENDIDECIAYLNKASSLITTANDPGISIFSKCYIVTWFYVWQGKIDLAQKDSLEYLRIAEESGDIYYKTPAYISYGVLNYVKRNFGNSESYLLEALTYAEKTGHYTNWMTACQYIFELYISKAEYKKARDYYEKMISIIEPTNYRPSEIGLYEIGLARAKALDCDQDIDLKEILKLYDNIQSEAMKNRCIRYICDILLNIDRYLNESEKWINMAIETDGDNNFTFLLGQDYALYSNFYKRKGDLPKAKEKLEKSIEILSGCGAGGWVEKYEAELVEIS